MLRPTARTDTGGRGHELACASCGAPLHHMKALRPEEARAASSHAPAAKPKKVEKQRGKGRKRRKPLWRKVIEEVVDELEDLFD